MRLCCPLQSNHYPTQVTSKIKTPQPSGRLANILSSPAPLTLIIPDSAPPTTFSAALRIAHDLDVYHRLDSEIIDASAALERLETSTMGVGNLVLFGGPENEFTTSLLQQRKTPFSLQERKLYLNGKLVEESAATLFLHPHPTSSSSLALVLFYNNPRALERGLRLFPIRTGVAVPDWIITTEEADFKAAAGVAGAG